MKSHESVARNTRPRHLLRWFAGQVNIDSGIYARLGGRFRYRLQIELKDGREACETEEKAIHQFIAQRRIVHIRLRAQGLAQPDCPGQAAGQRMPEKMKPVTQGSCDGQFQFRKPGDVPGTSCAVRSELLMSIGLVRLLRENSGANDLRPNLRHQPEQQHNSLVGFSASTCVRFALGDCNCRSRCPICREPETECHESQKYRRNDCNKRGDYCPGIPPHDTTRLAERLASVEALPPAHSLPPLWTGPHSAMAPQHAEVAHG